MTIASDGICHPFDRPHRTGFWCVGNRLCPQHGAAAKIGDGSGDKPRAASNFLDLVQDSAFNPQLVVHIGYDLQRFVAVWPDKRMNHVCQEGEEALRGAIHQIEPVAAVDPVCVPVAIVLSMLPELASRIIKAVIGRRHGL
jgi:hypothetical protein